MGILGTLPGWWLYIALGALGAGFAGLAVVRAKSLRIALPIRDRDVHQEPVSRLGGLAIAVGVVIGVVASLLVVSNSGLTAGQWMGIGGAFVVALCLGLLDDMTDLRAAWQLLGQVTIGLLVGIAGVGSSYADVPVLRSILSFGRVAVGDVPVVLGLVLFTVLWYLLIANALNWFDSVDGLAGSVSSVALFILALVALRSQVPMAGAIALSGFGACLGFLVWNWRPARMFMGGVGPLVLALIITVVSLQSGAKVATTVVVLALPLIDALLVGGGRLLRGQKPWIADQTHLPHYLRRRGWSAPQISSVLAAISGLFGILALTVQGVRGKTLLILSLALLVLLAGALFRVLEGRTAKRVH